MATSNQLPFTFPNGQLSQSETMDIDVEHQNVSVKVAHTTLHGSSTYSYEYSSSSTHTSLAPPTLNRNGSGYISDGLSIPGAFSFDQPRSSTNAKRYLPPITVTPPQQVGEVSNRTLVTSSAIGGNSRTLRSSSRRSSRASRPPSPSENEEEISQHKRRIVAQEDPRKEFELQSMKLINDDQSRKIKEQAEQIQAGLKYVQKCEGVIKDLKEAEVKSASELANLKNYIETIAMTREQDLKARELERKVQMDEFAALQKKLEASEKLVNQIHDRYLDLEADAQNAKVKAVAAENRKLEAEEKVGRVLKELELVQMTTATKVAEAHRNLEKQPDAIGSGNNDEEQIANMLIDERGLDVNERSDVDIPLIANQDKGKSVVTALPPSECDSFTTPTTHTPSWRPSTRGKQVTPKIGSQSRSGTQNVVLERPRDEVPKPITSKRLKPKPRLRHPTPLQPSQAPTQLDSFSTDDKLDFLLKMMLQGGKEPSSLRARRLFNKPIEIAPKAEGRNERNAWVREHMNAMLRIGKDADIVKYSDEIFADNTELHRKIAAYNLTGDIREKPNLSPMKIDWKDLNSRWNNDLFDMFKEYAEEEGYTRENVLMVEEEEELGEIFFNRLKRLQATINTNRPRTGETTNDTEQRLQNRKDEVEASKRRNARREGLFTARNTTLLAKSPDTTIALEDLPHEKKAWFDALMMHSKLGLAGQSSDDSMPDSDTHYVREMDWRAPDIVKRYEMVAKCMESGYTAYGKRKSGNKPRKRIRRKGYGPTSRRVPAGLPINFYDAEWYTDLNSRQQRDLGATAEMVFLTHVDDTL